MSELGRREFFTRLFKHGVSAATESLPALGSLTFPRRQLGRTGETVPIVGLGTASLGRGVGDDVAAMVLNRAVDLGMNYIDTAPAIGGYGRAHFQIRRALSARRKDFFLTTKLFEPHREEAWRLLEQSLMELGTDHVDLLYAHSLGDDKMNPELMFSKNGVFETLMQAKSQGLTRFVGISGHSRRQRFIQALADYEIDVMMTTANFVDAHTYAFDTHVWPFAQRRNVATIAMKVFGGVHRKGGHTPALLDEDQHDVALRYALSLEGCSMAVIGMVNVDEVEENARRARSFVPLTAAEKESLLLDGLDIARAWGEHLGPVE